MLSMAAGAQTVHYIYTPLADMNELVRQEKDQLTQQLAEQKSKQ